MCLFWRAKAEVDGQQARETPSPISSPPLSPTPRCIPTPRFFQSRLWPVLETIFRCLGIFLLLLVWCLIKLKAPILCVFLAILFVELIPIFMQPILILLIKSFSILLTLGSTFAIGCISYLPVLKLSSIASERIDRAIDKERQRKKERQLKWENQRQHEAKLTHDFNMKQAADEERLRKKERREREEPAINDWAAWEKDEQEMWERIHRKREQRARKAPSMKERRAMEPKDRRRDAMTNYSTWAKECETRFYDRASMTKLPFPPLARCMMSGCSSFAKSPVMACQHNVKQFFKGSGVFSVKVLQHQVIDWHPDRFASCREDLREGFQREANSLFVILQPWLMELRTGRKD